jgi:2-iminobutanoate/2-iminopropanoate deaminase
MTIIKRVISPHVEEAPQGLWSNCLVADGIVYITGQTASGYITGNTDEIQDDPDVAELDEYEQSKRIFTKIKYLMEAAGGAMSDIVKLNIYVINMENRRKIWAARKEFFSGNFPCGSLFQISRLANPAFLLEIDAIGHIGRKTSESV